MNPDERAENNDWVNLFNLYFWNHCLLKLEALNYKLHCMFADLTALMSDKLLQQHIEEVFDKVFIYQLRQLVKLQCYVENLKIILDTEQLVAKKILVEKLY